MDMRLIAAAVTLAALALAATAPAHAADQNFSVGNFEELIVEGDIIVNLEVGKAPAAKATGPRDRLGALRINREGNVVRIRLTGVQANRTDSGPVTVALSGRNIRRLALVGTGKINANMINVDKAKLELRGAGSIEVAELKASGLTAMLAGNGCAEQQCGDRRWRRFHLDRACIAKSEAGAKRACNNAADRR
jgi:hypothetical protein